MGAGYQMTNQWHVQDIVQLTVEGMNEGTPWALVRHFRIQELVDSGTVTDEIYAHWHNTILPAMAAELCDQWKAECMTFTRVAPGPKGAYFANFGAAIPGEISTDAVPNGAALLLKFLSDNPTARGRGRMFVPGLPESSTNAGLLLASKQDEWDAIAAMMTVSIPDAVNLIEPCVFSRSGFATLPNNFTEAQYLDGLNNFASTITSGKVIGNMASQRDRRYRRNVFGS